MNQIVESEPEQGSDKETSESSSALLYRDRPEWADVCPIYNSEREDSFVRIAVSDEFSDSFAYLRAMLGKNEMSERAHELTRTCCELNPANYTAWQYRRNIIRTLGKNIRDELPFSEQSILDNPKNYQVWNHRRLLVSEMADPSAEMNLVNQVLDDDAKNYHAWQHRHWVIEHFDLFSPEEVEFTTELLTQDVCNNSAWNYRFFIVNSLSDCFQDLRWLDREIAFTLNAIRRLPSNECPWSYLSGILSLSGHCSSDRNDVVSLCFELQSQKDPSSNSPHLYNFLLEQLVEELERTNSLQLSSDDASGPSSMSTAFLPSSSNKAGQDDCNEDAKNLKVKRAELVVDIGDVESPGCFHDAILNKASKYVELLVEMDPVRTNFWHYRRARIGTLCSSSCLCSGSSTLSHREKC